MNINIFLIYYYKNCIYLFLFINLINKNKLKNLFKIFNLISILKIRTNFIITTYNKKIIKK